MVNHGSKCYMEKSIQVMQLKLCTCLKKVLIPYCPLPAYLGPEPLLHPVYPVYMAPTVWHLVPTSVIKSTTEYLQCWQEYSKGVYNIHIFLVNEGSSYNDTLQVGFKLLLFKCKTLLLKYSFWNWAGNFFPAGQKVRCRLLEEKSYQGSNPAVNPPGKMHCWNSVMTYGGQVIISDRI